MLSLDENNDHLVLLGCKNICEYMMLKYIMYIYVIIMINDKFISKMSE